MTPDEILMQVAGMWRLDITWKDNDRIGHVTTVFANFEITDEVAELMLEAHGRSFGCPIDNPVTQEITPPVAID